MVTSETGRSIADRYSRDASAYLRHWAPVLLRPGLELLEGVPLDRARRVLDLGSGVGLLLPHISARLAAGGVVVGADRAAGMIHLAPEEFPRAVMDAARLAFADESFDVVVLAFMLFHLSDPARGLQEVHRVLRSGGMVAVATWAEGTQGTADQVWTEELDRAGATPIDPWPAKHEMMDTVEKVSTLLSAQGFHDISTATTWVEDPMDCEEFLRRRTSLGFSRLRFVSLTSDLQEACLRRARSRLARLPIGDCASHERAILAWATRP